MPEHRSGCPINLTLEVIGDRWSLLILRDMMFGNRRHFREMLRAQEGISSNILADRLKMLQDEGMITRADDPNHKQKAIYSLTEKAIELLPVFAQIGAWGTRHLPVTPELSIRAELLAEGGPALWQDFMDELREAHLGRAPAHKRRGPGVRERLQAAYEKVCAEEAEKKKSASPGA